MTDVTINRCTLRIVRHDGWGWGPEPRRLLQIAINALPELIARELARLWREDTELEFTAPISLRVPLRMNELLATVNEPPDLNSIQTSPLMQNLGERIGLAARRVFVGEPITHATSPASETAREDREHREIQFAAATEPGGKVLEALLSWHKQNVLAQRLAAFSRTALEAWYEQLTQKTTTRAHQEHDREHVRRIDQAHARQGLVDRLEDDSRPVTEELIERAVNDRARSLPLRLSGREAMLRRRLMVLTEVMFQLGLRSCTPVLLAALERALPLVRSEASAAATHIRSASSMRPGDTELNYESRGTFADVDATGEDILTAISLPAQSQSEPETLLTAPPRQAAHSDDSLEEFPSVTPRLKFLQQDHSPQDHSSQDVSQQDHSPQDFSRQDHSSQDFSQQDHSPQNVSGQVSATPQSPLERPLDSAFRQLQENVQSFPPPFTHSRQPVARSPQHPPTGEALKISTALPFLLLGPLSRLGYLKALDATLEAANALSSAPLFAAALAYKVLAPPARGWRRDSDSITAATAFAGLRQPAAEPALVQLAEDLRDHLSPLEAALSGALISGHDPQTPLMLFRHSGKADNGFLLLEVEGMFPIQWAANAPDLRQTLVQLEPALLLVPQMAAQPELLRWLDGESFHFVTEALPTRGEAWRALRRSPQERWWTNEAIMSDSALIKVARTMSVATEEAAALCEAMCNQRPGIPLARDCKLERQLALAASVAMGSVAWELWRHREPTTPQLALERFSDFEARVTWRDETVRVSLPLGKRFYDLRDHGLLDDVVDVPWFNERTLVFESN